MIPSSSTFLKSAVKRGVRLFRGLEELASRDEDVQACSWNRGRTGQRGDSGILAREMENYLGVGVRELPSVTIVTD